MARPAIDRGRVWRSIVWIGRSDLSGALAAVAILAALAAALIAKGFVKVRDPTAFYAGMVLMAFAVVLALLFLASAVVGRYREPASTRTMKKSCRLAPWRKHERGL